MEPEDFYKKMRDKLDADPPPAPRYKKQLWENVARELPRSPVPDQKWWWIGGAILLLLLNLALWWRLETHLPHLHGQPEPSGETAKATEVIEKRIVEVHRDTVYVLFTEQGTYRNVTAEDFQKEADQHRQNANASRYSAAATSPPETKIGGNGTAFSRFSAPPPTLSFQQGSTAARLASSGKGLGQFLATERFLNTEKTPETPEEDTSTISLDLLIPDFVWAAPDSLRIEKQAFEAKQARKKSLWQKVRQIPQGWELEAGVQLSGFMPTVSNPQGGGSEGSADTYPGGRAGLGLSLLFSDRWTLAAGLSLGAVSYEFDEDIDEQLSEAEISRLPQPFIFQGEEPEYVEINQTELFVPLTLRYQLLSEGRLQIFAGAGLTGRWLLQERFTYGYELEDPDEEEEEYVEQSYGRRSDEGFGWRNFRLEAGISYPLTDRLDVRSVFFYEPAFRKMGTLRRYIGLGGGQLGLWWRL